MKSLPALWVLLVSSLSLHAQVCAPEKTQGRYRAEVSDYLRAHVVQVDRSGERVVLVGDGGIFAVRQEKQSIAGFSDRIVLNRAGDSFIASFGAKERVNTVLSLVKADAAGIELRYRVMDGRSGVLRMDEGTVILPMAKSGRAASPGDPA